VNNPQLRSLYAWCSVPAAGLASHPQRRVPFRLCRDSEEMGVIMARELVEEIRRHNERGEATRAIIPCGPACWYQPFTEQVTRERVSLQRLVVFHMDECLDWQGRELPRRHPYSFRGFMERHFYDPVDAALAVPEESRCWLTPQTIETIRQRLWAEPIDITYGGWGQDGHIAYNQARRHPFSRVSLEDVRNSTIRIQDNNTDTLLALAQRTFGAAWQFVPPMSVTLGVKECLSARKVRLFSDTGAWKQTALRVALFSEPTPEYPITLLQEHPDALITATLETARHPISEHPEWDLGLVDGYAADNSSR
jgi:glucosamine-6-phosphate deaminase